MPKHEKVSRYEKYDEDGDTDHPTCPRCDSFLAQHDDRQTCGNCGYAEIEK